MLGIITVALLFAVGVYFAVKYFKESSVPRLNVSDEHLAGEDFADNDRASFARRHRDDRDDRDDDRNSRPARREQELSVVDEEDSDAMDDYEDEKTDPSHDANFTKVEDLIR